MEIPAELKNDIVAYLTLLPNMESTDAQRSLVYMAGLDSQLLAQINFGLPPGQFVQLLLATLTSYGCLHDGRDSIVALLQASKNYVGHDKQAECDALINAISANTH